MKDVKRAAVAGGIVWGGAIFVTTIASIYFNGYAADFLKMVQSIYPGYNISFSGSLIGAVYGFLDVFIGIYIIDWIYRKVRV